MITDPLLFLWFFVVYDEHDGNTNLRYCPLISGSFDLKDKGVCISLETEILLCPKNNNGSLSYAPTIPKYKTVTLSPVPANTF